MAETTRKRLGELTQGVFAVLIDRTEPLAASQVLKLTAERVPPTSFEHEMLPKYPKIRRFDNTIRFATVTTVKAGWLVKAKGEWSLTDEGRIAYDKFTEPEEFRREAERLYRAWKQGQPQPDPADPWAALEAVRRDCSQGEFQLGEREVEDQR